MTEADAIDQAAYKHAVARIAELEAAMRSIVEMQSEDEVVAYSWGQEYFRRAHAIAVAALSDSN